MENLNFGALFLTRKNADVEPPLRQPYLIVLCFDKPSADSMGDSILSTVKNAARLAVYDDIMINVKNHHMPATIRVDTALCCGTMLAQLILPSHLFY